MQKHSRSRYLPAYIIIIIALAGAGFAGGFYMRAPKASSGDEFKIVPAMLTTADNATIPGYEPANVSIEGQTIMLENGCKALIFDVTDDQAFSIAQGIDGTMSARPLTHDMFKDVIENFNISVNKIMIDRFEDGIYKATVVMQQGDKILEEDARPSDSIALAVRFGKTVFVSQGIMEKNATDTCKKG